MFLNDFSVKKSGILLPTYEDTVASSKFDASEADAINAASKKSPFALEQSFFGIFVV
jgi:hypothetical protein